MATPGQLQMFNKLEVNEMFSLGDAAFDKRYGEKRRIQIYPDEKVPDAVVIHVWLEDHTLGNSLRMELLRNKEVLFVGYKVPHPYNHMLEFRIQTLPTTTPEKVIKHAIKNLRGECKSMLEQFDEQVAAIQKKQREESGEPEPDEVMAPTSPQAAPTSPRSAASASPAAPIGNLTSSENEDDPGANRQPRSFEEGLQRLQDREAARQLADARLGGDSPSREFSPTEARAGEEPSPNYDPAADSPEPGDSTAAPMQVEPATTEGDA